MKSRIIFWIDAFLLHYCIAHYLQKNYDCDLYGIVDVTPKPKKFFDEQNLVQFKRIWFYNDHIKTSIKPDLEYLQNFESKYDINLWNLAINERLFYRFNNFYKFNDGEIQAILEQECRLFENILDETKPDFFIAEKPILHHANLFYEMCLRKGVTPILFTQSRIGYKSVLCRKVQELDSIDQFKNIQSKHRSFDELRNYLESTDVSKQIGAYKNKFASSRKGRFEAATNFLLSNNNHSKTYYSYFGRSKPKVLSQTISSLLKKKNRQRFIDNALLKDIPHNEKFVYFPLAMDEERNLLVGAPYYTNQIEVIRMISKSLPIDHKLYVKEHYSVAIRDWRAISEYKEIMEIPNVRLFHPSVKNDLFLKNCSLVITIAGTSGFEAAFYEKPAIIFAETNYSILPSVHKIKSVEELPFAIRNSLKIKTNSDDLDKFLAILEKDSIDFDLYGFISEMHDFFYYGGHLVNVEIPVQKMNLFLNDHKDILTKLALEHVKKINYYK